MKRTNEEKRLYDSYKSAIKNKQTPCFSKEEWMTLFQYLNRENKDDAFNVLDNAIEAYPDHRPFIITKAELALYDGLLDEAYDLLEIELADAPEGEVKHLWIDYYYSSGEDKMARQLLDDLFERKPKYMERTLEYIIPVLSDALDEDSHKYYTPYIQNAAKLFPKNPLLLEEWEKELMIQKRYEEAIGVCNQLIDNDPYSFMYWNDLAHLHMVQGEYEQAIEALDFALTISAEKEQVNQTKVFKGYCLYMNGSYEQAIELYQELSDNGRTEWEVNSLIAHCHVQMQHFDEAYEILKELIKHDEQEAYAIAMHDFVICCMMKGKREEAYQALKVAVSKHPLDEGLLMVYSLFGIFDKKKMPEIKNTIDRSITLLCPAANDPSISTKCYKLLEIGKSYLAMGDKENALVYFDLILRIRPDMEELQEPLSQVFADEEFPTKALSQHVVNIITQGEATEEELAEYLCNEDYKDTVKTDDAKQNLIQKLLSDEGINN